MGAFLEGKVSGVGWGVQNRIDVQIAPVGTEA